MGAPDFPRRPLADTFLYRTLVRVNAYKFAKFQPPSSIIIIIIIINEKINVAFSRRTARTRNSLEKKTIAAKTSCLTVRKKKIVMKMTARRAVSSAAA